MSTSLSDWKRKFAELDSCRWAGPRPIEETEGAMFMGREKDTREFLQKVSKHRLIVLSGLSGVGKSSLLNVKLLSDLKNRYETFVCRDWSFDEQEDANVDGLMRKRLGWPEQLTSDEIRDSERFCDEIDRLYRGKSVIILDQFEELIRYQPRLFKSICDWIIEANQKNETKIVVSLRTEQEHHLRNIERRAMPFSFARMELLPIMDVQDIVEIISNDKTGTDTIIDACAVERLRGYWEACKGGGQVSGKWYAVGLLHLQATLYALHASAKVRGQQVTIMTHHIDALLKDAGSDTAQELFAQGLRKAVSLKLERCKEACNPESSSGQDKFLIEGTFAYAQRMIPHLSSDGYKLLLEEWSLVKATLHRELESLQQATKLPEDRLRDIYRQMREKSASADDNGSDLLTVGRFKYIPGCSTSRELLDRDLVHGYDVCPWEEDPDDVSAGPMQGRRAVEVLVEEIRRVVFAQVWLETARLVRSTRSGPERSVVTLIHDVFADALEYWSRSGNSGHREALHLLSAAKGRTFDWRKKDPADFHPEFDGKLGDVTLLNLRWRDCQISASFRETVFVNCDFRGSRFVNCLFIGVVFVNCLMDNASFDACTILGCPKPAKKEVEKSSNTIRGVPSFKVDVSRSQVLELFRYREGLKLEDVDDESKACVFSKTSGLSVMPFVRKYDTSHVYGRQEGGLSMYGGRLSSLMIKKCTFLDADQENGGQLALRFIAGSSLDIVETADCRIDILGSSIRGLTITRPISEAKKPQISITAEECHLANTWFGEGLRGTAVLKACLVDQLFNLSGVSADDSRLSVTIKDSGFSGVVNASMEDSNEREPGWTMAKTEKELRAMFIKMDYRSIPAKMELTSHDLA